MATPLKKALGQISINTPRGAPTPAAAASHKKKPFSNVNRANVLQPSPATKPASVQLTGSVPAETAVAKSEPVAVAESESAAVADSEPAVEQSVAPEHADSTKSSPAVLVNEGEHEKDNTSPVPPATLLEGALVEPSVVAPISQKTGAGGASPPSPGPVGRELEQETPVSASPSAIVTQKAGEEEVEEEEEAQEAPEVLQSLVAPSAIAAEKAGEEETEEEEAETEEEEAQEVLEVSQSLSAPLAVQDQQQKKGFIVATIGDESVVAATEEEGDSSSPSTRAVRTPEELPAASVPEAGPAAAATEGFKATTTVVAVSELPRYEQQQQPEASEAAGGDTQEQGPGEDENEEKKEDEETDVMVVSSRQQQQPALEDQSQQREAVVGPLSEDGQATPDEDTISTMTTTASPHPEKEEEEEEEEEGGKQQQHGMRASRAEECSGSDDAVAKSDVGIVPEHLATAVESPTENGIVEDAAGENEVGVLLEDISTTAEDIALGNMSCAELPVPPAADIATAAMEIRQVDGVVVVGDPSGVGNDVSRGERPEVVSEKATEQPAAVVVETAPEQPATVVVVPTATAAATVEKKTVESVVKAVVPLPPAATLSEGKGHADVSSGLSLTAPDQSAPEPADDRGVVASESGEGRDIEENAKSTSLPPPPQPEVEGEVVGASMAEEMGPTATLPVNEEGAVVAMSVAKYVDTTATLAVDEERPVVEPSLGGKEMGHNAKFAADEEEEEGDRAVDLSMVEDVDPMSGTLTTSAAVSVVKSATAAVADDDAATLLPPPQVSMDEETRSLVTGSQYLKFTDGGRRVLCTLTGKKIAPDYMAILVYIGSRKVQRLLVEGPFVMSVSPQDI